MRQPPENVEALWSDLADTDAATAYRAMWSLTKMPKETVAHIAGQLKPVVAPDPRKVERLIADLNSQIFAVREKANRDLTTLDVLVAPALKEALKANPSLETRQRLEKLLLRLLGPINLAEHLRAVRAVEALEYTGTSGAKALLSKYAAGAAGARLTRHANDALQLPGKGCAGSHVPESAAPIFTATRYHPAPWAAWARLAFGMHRTEALARKDWPFSPVARN